jgi:small subunit ribosomal protein S18
MPKPNRDRPAKRRVNLLRANKVTEVDWKDVDLLRKFVSDRGKVATAIKNAREMALLPYPAPGRAG